MLLKLIFILWCIVAIILVGLLRRLINLHINNLAIRIGILIVEAFVFVIVTLTVMAGPVQLRILHYPLTGIYVALLGDIVFGIIFEIYRLVRIRKGTWNWPGKVLSRSAQIKGFAIAFGISAIFTAYGMINMEVVIPDYHTLESNKISQDVKFAYLSDVHAGSAQSFDTLEKVVDEINKEDVKFVVLGGDITDDFSTKEEMTKAYEILGKISAPKYFTYGNHDRQKDAEYAHGQQFTEEELQSTIEKNNFTILEDKFVKINDEIVILGREDVSSPDRKSAKDVTFTNQSQYNINFDHEPYEKEDMNAIKADLQVSGHTHAGQLWPAQIIYQLLGYDTYGEHHYGNTTLWISSGEAGWYVPMRTESHCHYDIFNIRSSK